MKIKFDIKIDEDLGIVYEYPIMHISGYFNKIEDLDEFIKHVTTEIRTKITTYCDKKCSKLSL